MGVENKATDDSKLNDSRGSDCQMGNSCITQFPNYHHAQFSHIFGISDNTLKQILSSIQHCFFFLS